MPSTIDVIDEQSLNNWALEYLPAYMKPNHYQLLDAIPLTANGKIDYQALVKVSKKRSNVVQQPKTSMQETVCRIWAEVLGHSDFGIDQPFFEVGGDSLLLVQVRNSIKKALNIEIATTVLFEHPSVETLSNYLETKDSHSEQASNVQTRTDKQKQALKNRRKANRKEVGA